ncbi:MAG: hypothetical protein SGI97_02780 [candidate division Zixibacteria bacterium]|mgnify:CR=1 FL=1|nr:hypothetical protein [candidate division Zixibacteria bacterium]
MSTDFGVWVAALLTIGILSFLYKDNPFYKLCESIFIGVSAGYWAILYYFDNLYKKMYEGIVPKGDAEPNYWLIGGAVLGIMMLFRLSSKAGWIARWPLAFIVGATAGLYMMIYFVSNALNQVASTIMPVITRDPSSLSILWVETIGTLVIAIGVITGLIYFFFSKEHRGAFGGAARIGIYFLMVTFGASFGYTVMSRMSLLIGRMDFLFGNWLGLIN